MCSASILNKEQKFMNYKLVSIHRKLYSFIHNKILQDDSSGMPRCSTTDPDPVPKKPVAASGPKPPQMFLYITLFINIYRLKNEKKNL